MNATNDIRVLNKAIYLIIEKYHRLYGLKLAGFGGGHGYGYGLFYIDSVLPFNGNIIGENYFKLIHDGRKLSLVCYLPYVGLPCWSHGEQLELKGWERMRTQSIVDWLLGHLTLESCFELYSNEISRWRVNYSVDQSEKYLLIMNLVGLYSTSENMPFTTLDACFSEYDDTSEDKKQAIREKLQLRDLNADVWGKSELLFATNGLALINGRDIVDVWSMYLAGKDSNQIIEELKARVSSK